MLKDYEFIAFGTTELPAGSSLVFAPHPDDETFGPGGSILKMTDNNQTVNVVMMTDGAAGGNEEQRKKELLKATEALGVKECYFFGAPDQGLEIDAVTIQKVIDLLNRFKPQNVFFTSPLEYHPDHRATAWLVWNALQSIEYKGNVFSYEIANQSPTSMLVDITDVMDRKIEIMKVYASQLEQVDYLETIKAANRLRAYTALSMKVHYAEAFFQFEDISSDLMSYYYNNFTKYHKRVRSEKLPLVSVLIRTKNRPKLLKNALDSIARQTYQQLEVNVVNDGGEEIGHIVDGFNFERSFVKNHETSQGRAAAANALLKMVQGEYCVFLDDDDTFDANHIENLIKIINKNENIDVCYSGVRTGNDLKTAPFNHPYDEALLRRGNYIPLHAILFSSKLIENSCKFDESFVIFEDWDFLLQLAQHTNFYHHDQITATYNLHGDSGAGLSSKKIDEGHWELKIYEKWSNIWDAAQLKKTFQRLEELNAIQLQNARQQNEKLRQDKILQTRQFQSIKRENEKLGQEKAAQVMQLQKTRYENEKLKQEKATQATQAMQVQNIKQQNEKLQQGRSMLEKEKEKLTHKLQKDKAGIGQNITQQSHLIDNLLEERLAGVDLKGTAKRDFSIVSARNYEQQCMDLFKEVFEQPMSQEFWDWKYDGVKWRGICAVKDGEVIAHYSGMRRDIHYFGEPKSTLHACDTMVSPRARGGIKRNSPFYNVAYIWIRSNLGINKEFLMSYGFPNKRVMKLAEKLGLYLEVDTITGVHWRELHKYGSQSDQSISIEEYIPNPKTNDEIGKLWNDMAAEFKESIIGIRDAEYLITRYLKHPVLKYKIYLVRNNKGELLAALVLKRENRSMVLMDLVAKKEHFKTAIEKACSIAKNLKCEQVVCWITKSKSELFNHCGATMQEEDISIPTSAITPNFDPEHVKGKWFLMIGDTDFL